MANSTANETASGKNPTSVERHTDRELIVRRTFNAPASVVFRAWTTPDLLKRWWAPKSIGISLLSCAVDARTGGSYRFAFGNDGTEAMVFFGRYLEVIPNVRLVWTNEETEQGSVTTVTLDERDGKTFLVLREVYPSKEALDESLEGMEGGCPEQYDQLDDLLETLV